MSETYTINMLKTFDECSRKYAFAYLQKIRMPENSNKMQTGNRLHGLINYHLKGQDVSKLLTLMDETEKALWENFEKLNIGTCIESEYSFNVKFAQKWLTGRIDAIFEKDGKYIIADWKTSDYVHNEKEQFQTIFYLYSVYNIFKAKGLIKEFDDLSLTYYILSEGKELTIKLDENLYNIFSAKIENILKEIQNASVGEKPEKHCKFCSYRFICN